MQSEKTDEGLSKVMFHKPKWFIDSFKYYVRIKKIG